MNRYKFLILLGAATLAVAGAFGACSSHGGGNVALNARTGPTATADDGGMGDAGMGDGGTAAGVDLGNGIVVERIRILVRKLEMDVVATTGDGGLAQGDGGMDDGGLSMGDAGHDDDLDGDDHDGENDDGDHGGGDVVRGPFLIDLSGAPLASGVHEAFDSDVPAGTYHEVCFDVNTISKPMTSADGGTDPGLAGMQALHASIVADGTIDGQAFEFTTPFEVAQCHRGTVTVGSGTTNLTFDVDYRGWFTGDNGERLDPNAPMDRGQILQNIRCSIRIFPDKDRDGHSDDGDDGEDDEGREGCFAHVKPPICDGGVPDGGAPDGGGMPDAGVPDGGGQP